MGFKSYVINLAKLAEENNLHAVIRRAKELERVMQILLKTKNNNPCLIGHSALENTAIVHGLAELINGKTSKPQQGLALLVPKPNVSYKFQGMKIFALDIKRLIAGAKNPAAVEKSLMVVIKKLKKIDGEIILFIDELHTLITAAGGGQAIDDALETGNKLRYIGATTIEEYKKHIENDAALKRRFQFVDVNEPSVDMTIDILKDFRGKYEAHHNVKYTDNALVAAANLSYQFITDRFNPEKSIDLIDEAGARLVMNQERKKSKVLINRLVTESDIRQIVAMLTGVPAEKVSTQESRKLLQMEKSLQKHIIGQPEAVEAVSRAVRRARVGIRDPNRPIASFLFTGPTGVGKTELANSLAVECFGSKEAIIRLDMSEYMEKHTVSKLFGSPPGYLGSDEGGQLTEAVHACPNCLVLFDEIEKAHHDVLNVLLQILEDGRLTDNRGKTVDFKNTIIIMTSNVGYTVFDNTSHEYLRYEDVKEQVNEELKRKFRPEFLNRIDDVIVFKKLSRLHMNDIVEVMLKKVYERVKKAKNISVRVTDSFKEKLVEEGYNPSYGARPMKRVIRRLLEDKLAERILNGAIKEGDSVTMDIDFEDLT